MPRSTFLAAVLALGWMGAAALAGEAAPGRADGGQQDACCDAAPCCCPDTYCKKPLPCVPCVKLGCGCDNYCKKPWPCIPCPVQSCCPDNYCKKPWPDLCRPLDRQFYRCPPCN